MTVQPKGKEALNALLQNANFQDERNKIFIGFELGRLYEKESKINNKNYLTRNCKSNNHKYCNGGGNAWGKCGCLCHE